MITINVSRLDMLTRVAVCRWPQSGRYPAVLASFDMLELEELSDLAVIVEVCSQVAAVCEGLRHQPY
jgi:hypothetical protein